MLCAAGRYADPLEAARAYDKAAVYLYGNSAIVSATQWSHRAWGHSTQWAVISHPLSRMFCLCCLQTNFGLEACRKDPTEVSSYIVKAKLLADEQKQCLAGGQTCSQQQGLPLQLPSPAQVQHTQAGPPAAALQVGPGGGMMVQCSLWAADPQQQQSQLPVMLVPASSSCASAAFTSSSSSNTSETLSHYLVPGVHQPQQEGLLSGGLCGPAGVPTSVLQAPLASAPQLQGGHFPTAVGPAASSSCLLSTQAGLQMGPVMPAGADAAVLLQPHTGGGAPPHAWQQQPQQMGYYQPLYPSPPQQQPQLLLQSGGSPATGSYAVWCSSPALHCGGPSFPAAHQQVSLTAVTPLEQQLTGLSLADGLQHNVSQFTPLQHNMLQQQTYFSLPSALQQISLQ